MRLAVWRIVRAYFVTGFRYPLMPLSHFLFIYVTRHNVTTFVREAEHRSVTHKFIVSQGIDAVRSSCPPGRGLYAVWLVKLWQSR